MCLHLETNYIDSTNSNKEVSNISNPRALLKYLLKSSIISLIWECILVQNSPQSLKNVATKDFYSLKSFSSSSLIKSCYIFLTDVIVNVSSK